MRETALQITTYREVMQTSAHRRYTVLGATWGRSFDASTYSGVPKQVFSELERRQRLAGWVDIRHPSPRDALHGALSLRRSLRHRAIRRDATWRYRPRTVRELSKRVRREQKSWPEHDIVLQFGVAGVPSGPVPLAAHIEVSVEVAASSAVFATSYGFDGLSDRQLELAKEGERAFIKSCDLIWTNTRFTARGLIAQGADPARLLVLPPPCGLRDPGEVERDWSQLHVLFVGKDWMGKGGADLFEAFQFIRRSRPGAQLTIIGCQPDVAGPGVNVLGYLSKDDPEQLRLLEECYRRATIFVMPSYWESTGVVYMEAAMYGLPVVMLKGQGRDELFPGDMALHLDTSDPQDLATCVLEAADDPERLRMMGSRGRSRVLSEYTTEAAVDTLESALAAVCRERAAVGPSIASAGLR